MKEKQKQDHGVLSRLFIANCQIFFFSKKKQKMNE